MAAPAVARMSARDPDEQHRASTPLELFFDLTFVVAVSLAAAALAHDIVTGRAAHGVAVFAMVFFAIWWGWLNFSWFASAYDTDDWLYRLVTLVQMGGALTVAAGVPRAFAHEDFAVIVVGYVIMRLAMVSQWLRAAGADPDRRRTALTYASGIATAQVLWILRQVLPHALPTLTFAVLVLAELAVPVVAERRQMTTYHPGHITERYGLFTIIVLGEGVLASGNSVIEALQESRHVGQLVTLAIGSLVVLAAMWWIYFASESTEHLRTLRGSLIWGYGHYLLFASAAAVSAGIEVQVGRLAGDHARLGELAARLSVGVPAASYVLVTAGLVLRAGLTRLQHLAAILAAACLLAVAFVPLEPQWAVVLDAAVLAGLVAVLTVPAGVASGRRDR